MIPQKPGGGVSAVYSSSQWRAMPANECGRTAAGQGKVRRTVQGGDQVGKVEGADHAEVADFFREELGLLVLSWENLSTSLVCTARFEEQTYPLRRCLWRKRRLALLVRVVTLQWRCLAAKWLKICYELLGRNTATRRSCGERRRRRSKEDEAEDRTRRRRAENEQVDKPRTR